MMNTLAWVLVGSFVALPFVNAALRFAARKHVENCPACQARFGDRP